MFLNIAFVKKNLFFIIIVAVILISAGGYKIFFGSKKEVYNFDTAKIENVVQEVSAVGRVKKGEEINLSFKQSGRIDKIYVEVGEVVEREKELIKLDVNQLSIQLSQAKASLDLARAEYDKLLAGASAQEIQVKQTAVDNSKIAYDNAKGLADENLKSVYENAFNALEDSYLKIYNAFTVADLIRRSYFNSFDEESVSVREKTDQAESFKNKAKASLDLVKASSSNENIDSSLLKMDDFLRGTYENLKIIREACEFNNYRNTVSLTDKNLLDNHKSYLNTALTNIVNSRQGITNTKITNISNIDIAAGNLKTAQDQLTLITAKPRQEDINLYEAKVRQAQASYNLLADQIADSIIKSPLDGQVAKINKEIGEQATLGETIISLIPTKPFQVETDISESDIGKIKIGNDIKIVLDAFPEEEFSGKVVEIDPAETVIAGVIYYKVNASLETEVEKIKPGMTANLTIIIDSKENVLTIPQRAVIEKNGKKFTRILKGENVFEETEIQTGLKGSSGTIEVFSGVKEGDKVVTSIKEK